MKIELNEIKVRKLTDGFLDSAEQGVVAYGGKLDIRRRISGNSSTRTSNAMR